jgi:microcystin-dependent protein
MNEPFLAGIYLGGFNFAPKGFAFCNGQVLAISTNAALFSLLGTTYGGNGTTDFQLPNLQGRAPIHFGQSSGTSNYVLGQLGGVETVTLISTQIPAHSHPLNVNSAAGNTATPGTTTYLAAGPATGSGPNASQLKTYTTTANNATLNANTIGTAGGSQPFGILQPYLTVNYFIAMAGIFPSRN